MGVTDGSAGRRSSSSSRHCGPFTRRSATAVPRLAGSPRWRGLTRTSASDRVPVGRRAQGLPGARPALRPTPLVRRTEGPGRAAAPRLRPGAGGLAPGGTRRPRRVRVAGQGRPEGKRPPSPSGPRRPRRIAATTSAPGRRQDGRGGDGSAVPPPGGRTARRSDVAVPAARGRSRPSRSPASAPSTPSATSAACRTSTPRRSPPQGPRKLLPGAVAALPGLPPDAAAAAGGGVGEVALTSALDGASAPSVDDSEPTWGALAKIIRETRFAFTFRRLQFMSEWWSVPTGDYWQEVRPLVASTGSAPSSRRTSSARPITPASAGSPTCSTRPTSTSTPCRWPRCSGHRLNPRAKLPLYSIERSS